MKKLVGKIAGLALLAGSVVLYPSGLLFADDDTDTMTLSGEVVTNCILGTPNTISFSTYDPVGVHKSADLNTTSTFDVTCTLDSSATAKIGPGQDWSGTIRQAESAGTATNFVQYQLFSGGVDTTPWGDGTAGTGSAAGKAITGIGTAETHTVYVTVPQDQNVRALDDYADSLTVTVTFTP